MRRAVWRVAWRVVAISLFLAGAIAGISRWWALPLMLIVAMLDAYESEDRFPFTRAIG
jgi:fatty acid desaturase